MLDKIAQIGLIIFGTIGIFLVARKNKWGFVAFLFAQPCYFYTSYIHKQWGLFIVTIVYTVNVVYGIYNWFGKKEYEKCSFCRGMGDLHQNPDIPCPDCRGTGRTKK